MSGGVRKKFQMTIFTMPNNSCSMKYALKSVPGLAHVGVLHGDEDGPGAQAPGSRSKIHTHHVDQHEKLKGLDVKKSTKGPNWIWWNVDSSAFLFRIDRIELVTRPALQQPPRSNSGRRSLSSTLQCRRHRCHQLHCGSHKVVATSSTAQER